MIERVIRKILTLQALVNQVAATIYARFHRKKLPGGRAVYGVFTRDYRYNTLNSQVTFYAYTFNMDLLKVRISVTFIFLLSLPFTTITCWES